MLEMRSKVCPIGQMTGYKLEGNLNNYRQKAREIVVKKPAQYLRSDLVSRNNFMKRNFIFCIVKYLKQKANYSRRL